MLELMGRAGLTVEELLVTPVPLSLVVPPRFHGRVLEGVHSVSALAARCWKTGLAYQFVAVARLGATARTEAPAPRRLPAPALEGAP
jgi:hypothetical protein